MDAVAPCYTKLLMIVCVPLSPKVLNRNVSTRSPYRVSLLHRLVPARPDLRDAALVAERLSNLNI